VNVVPGDGSSRLAGVIRGAISKQAARARPQLTFGTLVGDPPDLQPDDWTAGPFVYGTYYVVEPFVTGLLRTLPSTVPNTDVGDHGGHGHGEHLHELEYPILPLASGDRVLVCWVGPTPCVVGRLRYA